MFPQLGTVPHICWVEKVKSKRSRIIPSLNCDKEGAGWGKIGGIECGRVSDGFLVLDKLPVGLDACAHSFHNYICNYVSLL